MHWDFEAGNRLFLQFYFHFLSECYRVCIVLMLLGVYLLILLRRPVLVEKFNFADIPIFEII